jgi:hypothetical membrane protein
MKLFPIAVYTFLAVIVVAHLTPPPGYSWVDNTISDLASQGHRYKWIMQAGFIAYGLLLGVGVVWKSYSLGKINYPDLPILLYGLSVLVTGIYCTAPIDGSLSYSVRESQVHTIFATVAGFCLVAGILWHMIVTPERRSYHFAFLLLVTLISMLFGLGESGTLPVGKGIVQRALYLVSFAWLVLL